MAHAVKRLLAGVLAGVMALAPFAALAQPPKPAYVTGTITTGAIAKATGAQSVGTGDISGDCSTSGTLSLTCHQASTTTYGMVKVDGTTIGAPSGVLTVLGSGALTNPSTLGTVTLQQVSAVPSSSLAGGSLSLYSGASPRAFLSMGAPASSPTFVQNAMSAIDTYSVTLPAAPTNGNFLIASVFSDAVVPTLNTGWTAFSTHTPGCSSDPNVTLAFHKVGASESATQVPAVSGSGQWGASIQEVSGLGTTWGSSLQNVLWGCASGWNGVNVNLTPTTSAANTLALSFADITTTSSFPGNNTNPVSWNAGWINQKNLTSNNANSGMIIAGVASQAFPSFGSGVVATTSFTDQTSFRTSGQAAALVLLQPPGNAGAVPLSELTTIKNQGTTIQTNPLSINCSTGVVCSDDSQGNITVTATGNGGTVSTSGTPTTGALTKFSDATHIANAVAGTDFAGPTSGSSILAGNAAGGFANITLGTNLSLTGTTLNAAGITSVGLTAPSALLNVSGSPVSSGSGTLGLSLVTPTANTIFAADASSTIGAAPTFVSEGTGVGFENTSSTNVAYPANPIAGDTAFLQVSSFANSVPTFNTPAGWTLVTQQGDGCCIGAALFYKVLTGTESGTVTATFTAQGANNGGQAAISYWHGLKTTGTPYEAVATNVAHNSTAGVGSSVTTTGSNETVVTFWAPVVGSTTDPGGSTPASWTTAYSSDQTSTTHFNGRLIADYRAAASPTTISAASRTWTTSSTTWVAISLAMLPGPAAPSTPTFRNLVAADLPSSGVTAGSYTIPNMTVNTQGQVTAASNITLAGPLAYSAGTLTNSAPSISGTPTTGNCVKWSSATQLGDQGAACGSGTTNYYAGSLQYIGGALATSGSQTSVTVAIPSGYSDLMFVVSGRSQAASFNDDVWVRFNGDSGTNYARQTVSNPNATTASSTGDYTSSHLFLGSLAAASDSAGFSGAIKSYVPGYSSTTLNKTVLTEAGVANALSSGNLFEQGSAGFWNSTSAITSVTFFLASGGAFVDGDTVAVYGVGGNVTVNPQPGLPVISETVTSGSQASVTISSIPSTYRDLLVVVTGRGTTAAASTPIKMTLNGDTGANYQNERLFSFGNTGTSPPAPASAAGLTDNYIYIGDMTASTSTSNYAGRIEFSLSNYASTAFNKAGTGGSVMLNGANSATGNFYKFQVGSFWNNTAAVTSLTLTPGAGAFADGSVITVYGIGGGPTATLPVVPPQGRLTLTSNASVMTADVTAATTIYYTPHVGSLLPIGNIMYRFSQLSFGLNTTAHASGSLYDVFAYNASGAVSLCTGPAWTNSTTRSAAIQRDGINSIWENSSGLTCTLSASTSTTTIAAGQATYLGTVYATAAGQTTWQLNPAGTSGGAAAIMGLYNAYNQRRFIGQSLDNATWTYTTNATRACHGSTGNRVYWVDGLAQSTPVGRVSTAYSTSGAGFNWNLSASFDTTTSLAAGGFGAQANGAYGNSYQAVAYNSTSPPLSGLHFVQCVEMNNGGGTYTLNFNANMLTALDVEM